MSLKLIVLAEILNNLSADEEKQLVKLMDFTPIRVVLICTADETVAGYTIAYSRNHIENAVYELFQIFDGRYRLESWKFTIFRNKFDIYDERFDDNQELLLGPASAEKIKKYNFNLNEEYIIASSIDDRVHAYYKLEFDEISLIT
jgi:hypothetical protein